MRQGQRDGDGLALAARPRAEREEKRRRRGRRATGGRAASLLLPRSRGLSGPRTRPKRPYWLVRDIARALPRGGTWRRAPLRGRRAMGTQGRTTGRLETARRESKRVTPLGAPRRASGVPRPGAPSACSVSGRPHLVEAGRPSEAPRPGVRASFRPKGREVSTFPTPGERASVGAPLAAPRRPPPPRGAHGCPPLPAQTGAWTLGEYARRSGTTVRSHPRPPRASGGGEKPPRAFACPVQLNLNSFPPLS